MRFDRILLGLTLLAFAVRAALLLLAPSCELTGDESSWSALGTPELGRPHRGLSPLRVRLIFYPPLYPYFIAVLHRLFGGLASVQWAQCALGALLVPAVGRAGRLAFAPRIGLLAAAGVALYPDFVWFSVHFWSETLFVVLLWWAFERLLQSDETGSRLAAVAAGVLWGLATLTRELTLYLAPFAVWWLVRGRWLGRGRAPRPPRAGVRALVFSSALLLTLVPWTLRNALVYHAFIPVSTMGASNLWQGNVHLTHLEVHAKLEEARDPVERDRLARKLAWEAIRARQPYWILEKLDEQMPEFWKARSEILDDLFGRRSCGHLATRTVLVIEAVTVGSYLILLTAFVAGLARARLRAGGVLLLALLGAWNLAHVVAYATTRFRLPLLPVAFLFGAAAVVGSRDGALAPLRGYRLLLLVLLAVLALALVLRGLDELSAWRAFEGLSPVD